ncbi:cysteine protease StiP domain-containing protein [Pseudomonas wadenswilerensis]
MTEAIASLETVGSGSYLPDDVHFLLRPVRISVTDIEEKERLIQTRRRHYSEMLGREHVPSEIHKQLYARALASNSRRMATEVQALAHALDEASAGPVIVLVSFVRAGLPLGVLLRRALRGLGREVHHYGISIVRDRGIDRVALEAVIRAHGAADIVFVDGWTGKGAIATELKCTLAGDPRFPAEPRLVVLADPCGRAWLSASAEDWLIPCGILGATVSGLVSRSIWPTGGGLHGCVVYDHLHPHDESRAFIERIEAERRELGQVMPAVPWTHSQRKVLQAAVEPVLRIFAERHSISDPNRLKPGIAEATRAVLRRLPDQVLVRNRNDSDVQLLLHLTERAGVAVEEVGTALGPYRALTLIRSANP